MLKSGLEKIFLKSLHAQSLFRKIFLLHRKDEFCKKYKFSYKKDLPGGDLKKNLYGVCIYDI